MVQSESLEQESRLTVDVDPPEPATNPSIEISLRPPQPTAANEQNTRATLNLARAIVHFRFNCADSIELPVYVAPNPRAIILAQLSPLSPMGPVTEIDDQDDMVLET